MKKVVFVTLLFWSFPSLAQQFVLEKGKDTLFIGEKDTVFSLAFEVERTTIGMNPQLIINVHSTMATQGKDFALRDAYNANTKEINISNVENMVGNFQIFVRKNLKDFKSINLQTIIKDNGKPTPGITKLVLAPASKKGAKEEKPKEAPKDSLAFIVYHDINVNLYRDKDTKLIIPKKSRPKSDSKYEKFINIHSIKITQLKANEYRIQITTTENEVYYASIELTNEYHFKENDYLYLNGDQGAYLLHAAQIFRLEVEKANESSKGSASSNEQSFKFKI